MRHPAWQAPWPWRAAGRPWVPPRGDADRRGGRRRPDRRRGWMTGGGAAAPTAAPRCRVPRRRAGGWMSRAGVSVGGHELSRTTHGHPWTPRPVHEADRGSVRGGCPLRLPEGNRRQTGDGSASGPAVGLETSHRYDSPSRSCPFVVLSSLPTVNSCRARATLPTGTQPPLCESPAWAVVQPHARAVTEGGAAHGTRLASVAQRVASGELPTRCSRCILCYHALLSHRLGTEGYSSLGSKRCEATQMAAGSGRAVRACSEGKACASLLAAIPIGGRACNATDRPSRLPPHSEV